MNCPVLLATTAHRLSLKLNSHQIAHLAPIAENPSTPSIQRLDFSRQSPAKIRAIERRRQRAIKFVSRGIW
jgi:hypothetical protein